MTAGPSASAEGPVALYIGFIAATDDGQLPVRVRVVGDAGAVCGTAMVEPSSATVGFYSLVVATADEKAGCPRYGDTLQFRLLYDALDEGRIAQVAGTDFMRAGGNLAHLFPGPVPAAIGFWTGPTPTRDVTTTLIWEGPDGVSSAQAIQTIPVAVHGLWHLLPGGGRYVSYTPGAPLFAQSYPLVHTGDIVFVRAR